ncbi:MAG: hypothetical protein J5863_03725 [Desulfovibrio sp.]|nr:hypothetical protein [Desulfovibrio sp.]
MNRTASLALAALLLASLPAPASAVPLERISEDDQPIDIVSAALRGSDDDINTVLARSAKIFVMKTWNGTTADARDVAVYYALFCGRPEAARHILKRGVGRGFDELAGMPRMDEACKGDPTTETARRAIVEAQKEQAQKNQAQPDQAPKDQAQTDQAQKEQAQSGNGAGAKTEPIVFAALSPEALDVVLDDEDDYCQAVSASGKPLRQHLQERKDAEAALKVFEARCQ